MRVAKLYLIGHPVKHSVSPRIYTRAFKELGINAAYDLIDVDEQGLPAIVAELRGSEDCLGFNVTIPHKVRVKHLLDSIKGPAQVIGAVNTVVRSGEGLAGINTDWIGFRKALERVAGTATYGRALIIGAGGAGRAATYGLLDMVDELIIVSRGGVTARSLAKDAVTWGIRRAVGLKASPKTCVWAALRSDLIVNASPVGMVGHEGTPVPKEGLARGTVVLDMVYNPLETELLRNAREAGCVTIDGLWMLVYQANENLREWFGVEASIDALREEGLKVLRARTVSGGEWR